MNNQSPVSVTVSLWNPLTRSVAIQRVINSKEQIMIEQDIGDNWGLQIGSGKVVNLDIACSWKQPAKLNNPESGVIPVGRCAPTTDICGCSSYIENGIISSICVD